MNKLILLSIVVAAIAIPAVAARTTNPRAGLKKALVGTLIFNLVYLVALMFVWGRF